MDLALNNLQRLICHKTQQTKPFPTTMTITAWAPFKKSVIKTSKFIVDYLIDKNSDFFADC